MSITLLTDFGTRDPYAGVMKGVIQTTAPSCAVIDLTHEISPQDIRAASFALKTAYRYFPPGTVHLVVVDPGVGSARRPIAARIGEFFYVCPDNGVLSHVLAEDTLKRAVTLDNPHYHRPDVSRTFHGRDIFAPAAAHLASGVPLEALGSPTDALTTFPVSRATVTGDTVMGHVVYVDVYGNAITDIAEGDPPPALCADPSRGGRGGGKVVAGGVEIAGPVRTYSDAAEGEPVALFGSSGHLELAVRNGNASRQLGLHVGDEVRLTR